MSTVIRADTDQLRAVARQMRLTADQITSGNTTMRQSMDALDATWSGSARDRGVARWEEITPKYPPAVERLEHMANELEALAQRLDDAAAVFGGGETSVTSLISSTVHEGVKAAVELLKGWHFGPDGILIPMPNLPPHWPPEPLPWPPAIKPLWPIGPSDGLFPVPTVPEFPGIGPSDGLHPLPTLPNFPWPTLPDPAFPDGHSGGVHTLPDPAFPDGHSGGVHTLPDPIGPLHPGGFETLPLPAIQPVGVPCLLEFMNNPGGLRDLGYQYGVIDTGIPGTQATGYSATSPSASAILGTLPSSPLPSSFFQSIFGLTPTSVVSNPVLSAITDGIEAVVASVSNVGSSALAAGSEIVSTVVDTAVAAANEAGSEVANIVRQVTNKLPFMSFGGAGQP